MGAWINFGILGFVALILFTVCTFLEINFSNAPRLLIIGIIFGIPLGLISDVVLRGTYSYPLGYNFSYLFLNAAVVYGFLTATVLLLQRTPAVRFGLWSMAIMAVYETTNHFFPVWNYTIVPFSLLLLFIVVGYFATAVFIALIATYAFGYRFRVIDQLIRRKRKGM